MSYVSETVTDLGAGGYRAFLSLFTVSLQNYLIRNTIMQDRLKDLMILNIELEIFLRLNYDELIDNFDKMKAHRKCFQF